MGAHSTQFGCRVGAQCVGASFEGAAEVHLAVRNGGRAVFTLAFVAVPVKVGKTIPISLVTKNDTRKSLWNVNVKYV